MTRKEDFNFSMFSGGDIKNSVNAEASEDADYDAKRVFSIEGEDEIDLKEVFQNERYISFGREITTCTSS